MTETHRYVLEARRPPTYGGGACTLLVRHIHGHVQMLFHCDPETGAVLTGEQAHALADALVEAAADAPRKRAGQ